VGRLKRPPPEPLEQSGTDLTPSFKAALKRGEDVGDPAPRNLGAPVYTGSIVPTTTGTDVAACKGETGLMEVRIEGAGPAACMGAGPATTGARPWQTRDRLYIPVRHRLQRRHSRCLGGRRRRWATTCRLNSTATRAGACGFAG
jgi:hypothetical protein